MLLYFFDLLLAGPPEVDGVALGPTAGNLAICQASLPPPLEVPDCTEFFHKQKQKIARGLASAQVNWQELRLKYKKFLELLEKTETDPDLSKAERLSLVKERNSYASRIYGLEREMIRLQAELDAVQSRMLTLF